MDNVLIQAWKLTGPWILYDGQCPLCLRGERWFGNMLRRRCFRLATLQSDVGRHFAPGPIVEMKAVTREGNVLGGAEALAYISCFVWWAMPLSWLWRVRFLRGALKALYQAIAARRGCVDVCHP